MVSLNIRRCRTQAGLASLAFILAGCSSLPSSGPTAHEIVSHAAPKKGPIDFNVVDLDPANIDILNQSPAGAQGEHLSVLADAAPVNLIGPGDRLSISLYEVGVSLFAGARPMAAAGSDSFDASAHSQQFADVVVDQEGNIRLPFAGSLNVAGKSPVEVEQEIERRLSDKSQHPQVVVNLSQVVFSSVIITGDVRRPGRMALTSGRERLIDMIAAAGGTEAPTDDMFLRFSRNGRLIEQRLADITSGSSDDLVLDPGDRIQLVRSPRTFTAFGATGRVSQIPFDAPRVTLAQAIARAGGPNDSVADPAGIFLFRLGAPLGPNNRPNIYRISMLKPQTYFWAQKLAVQNNDLIYFANARANQPSKFVAIINQLFSPAVAIRAVSN
jgi:polysaccharide biosynthesis/export protein